MLLIISLVLAFIGLFNLFRGIAIVTPADYLAREM